MLDRILLLPHFFQLYLHSNRLIFAGVIPPRSLLRYPKFFFKKRTDYNKRKIIWEIRAIYRKLIQEALQSGVSRADLHLLLETKSYLDIPTYDVIRLKTLKKKLKILRYYTKSFDFLRQEINEVFEDVLSSKVTRSSWSWNPAYPRVQKESEEVLAPILEKDDQHEIIFYVIPSPYGIRWESACGFLGNIINYFKPGKHHYIGHVAVELRSHNKTIALTGMTGETNWQIIKRFFFHGLGFGFLFRTFVGRLENYHEVRADLAKHIKKKKLNYIRFKVPKSCIDRSEQFLKEWCDTGMYQKYGLWQDPLKKEGAGCASFGMGFLELTGLIHDDFIQNWPRTICLHPELIGGEGTDNHVSWPSFFYKVLFTKKYRQWSSPEQSGIKLTFWDPDAIYNWIESQHLKDQSSFEKESSFCARGLKVNYG